MPTDRDSQGTDGDSSQKQNGTGSERPKSTQTKRRTRRVIVYNSAFAILVGVAGIVYSVNPTFRVVSVLILLAALFFAAFGLRLSLINHGSTKAAANRCWLVVVIPSLLVCGCILGIEVKPTESPQSERHFKFWLKFADFPQDYLRLTNDFFEVPQSVRKISDTIQQSVTHIDGYIFVPVRDGQSNVSFSIVLINASETVSQGGRAVIFVPSKWNCRPGDGWATNESKRIGSVTTYGNGSSERDTGESWIFRLDDIQPSDGSTLSPVQITPTLGAMVISASAGKPGDSTVMLCMTFVPPANGRRLIRPVIIKTTENANGTRHYAIPSKDFTTNL
jgi:hypothetical protein